MAKVDFPGLGTELQRQYVVPTHAPLDALSPGRKFDAGKPRWSLLPMDAVELVIRVLEHGARLHAEENWKKVDGAEVRYRDAIFRHAAKIQLGEALDADSGLPHAAHIACNALFLTWFHIRMSHGNVAQKG